MRVEKHAELVAQGLAAESRASSVQTTSAQTISAQRARKAPIAHVVSGGGGDDSNASDDGAGRVEVALSKYISQQLNPTTLADERKARVAALKQLVESGTYFQARPSDATASKIANGLDEEVAVAKLLFGDEE